MKTRLPQPEQFSQNASYRPCLGFTLIELLVVIAIIAILAVMLLVSKDVTAKRDSL